MKELQGITQGVGNGAKATTTVPMEQAPDKARTSRIRAEAQVQVQNTNAAGQSVNYTTYLDLFNSIFNTWQLKFGFGKKEIVDNSLPFARMREALIEAVGHDMLVYPTVLSNPNAGRPVELAQMSASPFSQYATFTSPYLQNGTTTQTYKLEFIRAFTIQRLGAKSHDYTPGTTQMKSCYIEISRTNGAFVPSNANLVQNGVTSITISVDTIDCDEDIWAPVPRVITQDESGRTSHGPAGAIFAVWETTQALSTLSANPTLTLIDMLREGDTPVHEKSQAFRVGYDHALLLPLGDPDLNYLVTVLFSLPELASDEWVPTSSAPAIYEASLDLNPMHTVWLHSPVVDMSYIESVGTSLVSSADPVIRIANYEAVLNKEALPHVTACKPLILMRPGHRLFELIPSREFRKGATAGNSVTPGPSHSQAIGLVASAGTVDQKDAARVEAARKILKYLPGKLSATRGASAAPGNANVRATITTLGLHRV